LPWRDKLVQALEIIIVADEVVGRCRSGCICSVEVVVYAGIVAALSVV
jgi:hypothetical protein